MKQRRYLFFTALALTLLVVATTPLVLTQARYTAKGSGAAQGRVAKFEPRIAQVAGLSGASGFTVRVPVNGSTTSPGGTGFPGGKVMQNATMFPKYYFRNRSEVAVRAKPVLAYVPNPYGALNHSYKLHGLYAVGEYYGSGTAPVIIPKEGIEGGTTGLKQLLYTTHATADSAANRAAQTNTGSWEDLSASTHLGQLFGAGQVNTGSLFHHFVQAYPSGTLPGRAGVTTPTKTTYDMKGYWRTYRLISIVNVTQVD